MQRDKNFIYYCYEFTHKIRIQWQKIFHPQIIFSVLPSLSSICHEYMEHPKCGGTWIFPYSMSNKNASLYCSLASPLRIFNFTLIQTMNSYSTIIIRNTKITLWKFYFVFTISLLLVISPWSNSKFFTFFQTLVVSHSSLMFKSLGRRNNFSFFLFCLRKIFIRNVWLEIDIKTSFVDSL